MSTSIEDKYEVLEKIGHGSFGIIRRVKRRSDGQILCRKEINYIKMSQKEREQLQAEFSILSSLRHPNIVGYYHREHLKSSQDLHLYMEYCGNGDLGRVIKDLIHKRQYAEEGFVWAMFSQLVTALYRCHYGIDPPEVGSNVMGAASSVKPKIPAGGLTILHRDLKPENVFLGEDNSVKLGDFGLSKIMAAHDFASTYVGTPFYMSPEICASERYTAKSDIWSLGCIIYELCAREPPFNAKSHLQLIQRIREGHVKDIPSIYSPELMQVIRDCLKVNSDRRPDTAKLLNLPIVRLMRKEKEVVDLSRMLKSKEEIIAKRIADAEAKSKQIESEKSAIRSEIEASVRREWEVKARLEIDRQVAIELADLQRKFDVELAERVDSGVATLRAQISNGHKSSTSSTDDDEIHQSSISTTCTSDFTSTTDLTEYIMDSPEPLRQMLKKSTRTPFHRAQTMFNHAGTPMDVDMSEPSPISIASLSLSPRRNNASAKQSCQPSVNRDIFRLGNTADVPRLPSHLISSDSEDEEDDDIPLQPSPSRAVASKKQAATSNPYRGANGRPALISQRTAPILGRQNLATNTRGNTSAVGGDRPESSKTGFRSKLSSTSPVRQHLSKIPSSSNLSENSGAAAISTSPTRKSSLARAKTATGAVAATNRKSSSSDEQFSLGRIALKNNAHAAAVAAKSNGTGSSLNPGSIPTVSAAAATTTTAPGAQNPPSARGRTLVELQQARAGGRSMSEILDSPSRGAGTKAGRFMHGGKMVSSTAATSLGHIPAVWDPETEGDDMPSPFKKDVAVGLGAGGTGFKRS